MSKHFIISGLLIVLSLGILLLFPDSKQVNPIFQSLVLSTTFFLVIPLLYCKIVLKESLQNMGLQKGDASKGILAGTLSVAGAMGILFFVSQYVPLTETYVLPVAVATSFWWFMLYELVLVTGTIFLYEVFFRGFIQLLWLRNRGVAAIITQAVFFLGLFVLSSDVSWQTFPLLLFSPLAGIIAYYSQSIWYSLAASWVFLFLTDVFFLIQK